MAYGKYSIQFNASINQRLKELCHPLYENFGITTFACLKFLKDGKILHITNNYEWLCFYVTQNLFNNVNRYIDEINSIPENKVGYYLRSSKISNNFNNVLEKFGLWHGISVYIRYPEYTEAWCFATSSDNHFIHNIYLNHMDVLKHFILYFKAKGYDLIDHSDEAKLLKTPAKSFILSSETSFEVKLKNFYNNTKIDTIFLGDGSNLYQLSPREAECMKHLSTGKAVKEIAHLLEISPRTVESYINTVKQKVGCTMKNDLINHFTKLSDFTLLDNFHR